MAPSGTAAAHAPPADFVLPLPPPHASHLVAPPFLAANYCSQVPHLPTPTPRLDPVLSPPLPVTRPHPLPPARIGGRTRSSSPSAPASSSSDRGTNTLLLAIGLLLLQLRCCG